MLTGGIPPIPHVVPQTPQTATLQAGQSYAALVRAQNGTLIAQIGTVQITLPEGTGLTAGQRITVQVLSAGSTLQVEISPAPGTARAASPAPTLDSLLRPILQTLGKADLAPRAASLLPLQAANTPASLQPLLTVLLSERGLGQELQQLQQILTTASAGGAIPNDAAAAVAQWLGLAPGPLGDSWRNLLERARAERAVAARIASTLGKSGNANLLAPARDGAASLVQRLLVSETFTAWLQERGELETFKSLAQRIQDRALGGDVQNLRALDQPYQFLELPVRERDGFRRLHLHSFSEEGQGPGEKRSTIHRTVLDIDTTRLGPLWIALQAVQDRCACRIRTTSPDVAALFEQEAGALQESLAGAGYGRATITVEHWDGNRHEALFELLSPYQKLDLEG